jgi:hypothetical protein
LFLGNGGKIMPDAFQLVHQPLVASLQIITAERLPELEEFSPSPS